MVEKLGGCIFLFDEDINSQKIENFRKLRETLLKNFEEFYLDFYSFSKTDEFDDQLLNKDGLLFVVCVISQVNMKSDVIQKLNEFPIVKQIIIVASNIKGKQEILKLSNKVRIVTDEMNLLACIQKIISIHLNFCKYVRRRCLSRQICNPIYDEKGNFIYDKPSEMEFVTYDEIFITTPKLYNKVNKLVDVENFDYYIFKQEEIDEKAKSEKVIFEEIFSCLNFNLNIENQSSTFKHIIIQTFKDKNLFRLNINVLENVYLTDLKMAKNTKELCNILLKIYTNSKYKELYNVINEALINLDIIKITKLKFIIVGLLQNFRKEYNNFKTFKSMCKFTSIKESNKISLGDLLVSCQMLNGFSNKNYAKNLYMNSIKNQYNKSNSNVGTSNESSSNSVYLKFIFENDNNDSNYFPYIVIIDDSNKNKFKILLFPLLKFIVKKVKFLPKLNILKVAMKSKRFYPILKFSFQSTFEISMENQIKEMTKDQLKLKIEKEIEKLKNCEKNIKRDKSSHPKVLTSICLTNIGILHGMINNYNDSSIILEEAIEHKNYFFSCESEENGYLFYLIAKVKAKKQDFNSSVENSMKSLNIYNTQCLFTLGITQEEKDIILSEIYDLLGYSYDEMKNFSLAYKNYNISLEYKNKIYGCEHYSLVKTLNNIGCLFYKYLKLTKALEYFEKASNIAIKYHKDNSYESLICLNNMAAIYYSLNSHDKANEFTEMLIRCMKK